MDDFFDNQAETPDDLESSEAWEMLEDESRAAFAAFCSYYMLPPRIRSINEAFRHAQSEKGALLRDHKGIVLTEQEAKAEADRIASLKAPGRWREWSIKYQWVKRSAAWDQHVAQQDADLWLERKAELRQRDWAMGDEFRRVVEEGLIEAKRFIRRKTEIIPGENGKPTQIIITEQFDIVGLAKVGEQASKFQRLATDNPTDIHKWSGAILDKQIESELARLTSGSEAGNAFPFAPAGTAPD